jgi:YgiT-type zinc finger domain-containing protein
MSGCDICGEAMEPGGVYRALDGAGREVRDFPAEECPKCGHIRPDGDALEQMRDEEVPTWVRVRAVRRAA